MESYNTNAVVDSHHDYALGKKRWDGSFASWAGQDYEIVNGPEMCGYWMSDTSHQVGENTSC